MRRVLKRYGEIIVTSVILVISLLLLLLTNTLIPVVSNRVSADVLGTKFWPVSILVFTVVLCVILLVQQFRKLKVTEWDEEAEEQELAKYTDFRLISLMVLTVIYVVALQYIGFILSTPIYLIIFCYLIGITKVIKNVGTSLGFTAILVFVFGKFLYVPLPRGLGILREFSFFFY
jgi:uncharacterized membrane protein